MVNNGCGQSSHETVKLTVSEELNELIFCRLVQIQESQNCFNDPWVVVLKNSCGILVHETLKSEVS